MVHDATVNNPCSTMALHKHILEEYKSKLLTVLTRPLLFTDCGTQKAIGSQQCVPALQSRAVQPCFLSASFYSSPSAPLTSQSASHLESAIIADMGINIWFCSPSHNDFLFFFFFCSCPKHTLTRFQWPCFHSHPRRHL